MHPEPCFERSGFILRRARQTDVPAALAFQLRNFDHFASTSPRRPPDFGTERFWAERIALSERDFQEDRACSLCVFEGPERIVGTVSLMNFVRGALQGCDLGYAIDAAHQGTGLMFWAVTQAVRYAFETLKLHRIEAACIPANARSIRVLEKAGFQREGLLRSYLRINGNWQDHYLYALISDDRRRGTGSKD